LEECSNWSGRVVRGGSLGVIHLRYQGGVDHFVGWSFGAFSLENAGSQVVDFCTSLLAAVVDFGTCLLACGGRLLRTCRVSITSCNLSVPSLVVDFGESRCVLALRMLRRLWIFVLTVVALIFFLFFWLIPSLSRFASMTFSFIDLEPTNL
jgi:hypothetical protein